MSKERNERLNAIGKPIAEKLGIPLEEFQFMCDVVAVALVRGVIDGSTSDLTDKELESLEAIYEEMSGGVN